MKSVTGIGLSEVQQVYSGVEGDLWELIMGEQIHIGGFVSSMDLAKRAGIAPGTKGVDLCCCNGAGMRFLTRFLAVAEMTGVDATAHVIDRGRQRCQRDGLADRAQFVQADVCATGLPPGAFDFVWGEDAWCYVQDKHALLAEAARLLRQGGTIAFTDWVEGSTPLTAGEADRLLRFMKFPNIQDIQGYRDRLCAVGCDVEVAQDTGRFAPYVELYLQMVGMQLTGDALRLIGFDQTMLGAIAQEMQFMQQLANEGKLVQGIFVARKN